MRQDNRRRRIHTIVCLMIDLEKSTLLIRCRTPAAAAVRSTVRRLRDIINVQGRLQALSSISPRAMNLDKQRQRSKGADELLADPMLDILNADLSAVAGDDDTGASKTSMSQLIMNRLYNRWIVEFSDEDGARRFARIWNRRVLPLPKVASWRATEEARMVNAEFLW